MKSVVPNNEWPESWRLSYAYDQEEVYGEHKNLGYAYAYENRRNFTLNMLSDVLPVNAEHKVLDIAAAQGNFSLALAELGYDVTWNDLRANLVAYVEQKYEHGKIAFAPGSLCA